MKTALIKVCRQKLVVGGIPLPQKWSGVKLLFRATDVLFVLEAFMRTKDTFPRLFKAFCNKTIKNPSQITNMMIV